MTTDLKARIARLATDRQSGASELVANAIGILRDASRDAAMLADVASAVEEAQPSMAPIWNAAAAARRGDLERFAQRAARTNDAVARFAVPLLETGVVAGRAVRVITLSYSATVAHVLETLTRRRAVQVSCAEGRPAGEGRRLAARLCNAGVVVAFYVDAAIATALRDADCVLVGADALTSRWFLNKVGTGMLAAAAALAGVPVYVAAGREKFAGPAIERRLTTRPGPTAEVWEAPPTGVTVANPLFEQVPLDLISAVITDVGVLGSADVSKLVSE